MTQEQLHPAGKTGEGTGQAAAAGGCCTPSAASAVLPTPVADSQPCCGTAQEAADAGSCCGPAAKATAVTAGVGCCG